MIYLLLTYCHCSEDISKCINSAEKGFKIWSSKSITSRMAILSTFASTLNCSGYVYKCVKLLESYLYIFMS